MPVLIGTADVSPLGSRLFVRSGRVAHSHLCAFFLSLRSLRTRLHFFFHLPAAVMSRPPATSATAANANASSAPAASSPRVIVHRRRQFGGSAGGAGGGGGIVVSLVEHDLTLLRVDALVNAANALSFTAMDNGVSGALRRACAPADVVRKAKRWWDDEGVEHCDKKLPTTQAGVQPAAGALLARGVQHIIHAVGPTWTDYPIAEKTFGLVTPKIRRVIRRALQVAERVGARAVAVPAVSGGIFTHWKEGSDIKEREQRAARKAVLQAVFQFAEQRVAAESLNVSAEVSSSSAAAANSSASATAPSSTLREILVCDLSARAKGAMHLFLEEWDALLAAHESKLAEP